MILVPSCEKLFGVVEYIVKSFFLVCGFWDTAVVAPLVLTKIDCHPFWVVSAGAAVLAEVYPVFMIISYLYCSICRSSRLRR